MILVSKSELLTIKMYKYQNWLKWIQVLRQMKSFVYFSAFWFLYSLETSIIHSEILLFWSHFNKSKILPLIYFSLAICPTYPFYSVSPSYIIYRVIIEYQTLYPFCRSGIQWLLFTWYKRGILNKRGSLDKLLNWTE